MSSNGTTTTAIPQGALVLVTGANGFVGSHVVEQLLEHGYRVRGTARSTSKLDSLKKRWDEKYPGKFEVAIVENILAKDAFNEVTKGCDGVAHVASNVSFSTDLDAVVKDAVEGTLNALRAAASTPSVKRVVLTSSIAAVGSSGGEKKLGSDDYNLESVEMAKSLPVDDPHKAIEVYRSSKTQAEQAAWRFLEENKPSFVMNSVAPSFCLAEWLNHSEEPGSSVRFVKDLFTHKSNDVMTQLADIEFVSTVDIALLHVGALTLPDVKNERLIGSAFPATWNEILAVFRKHFPEKTFYDDGPISQNPHREESIYETDNSLEVLRKMGKKGWTSLEKALLETVAPFA